MRWKRERDDEVERERSERDGDGMGMEDAGSVERIRGSGNGEGRGRGFLWVLGSGTPKKCGERERVKGRGLGEVTRSAHELGRGWTGSTCLGPVSFCFPLISGPVQLCFWAG